MYNFKYNKEELYVYRFKAWCEDDNEYYIDNVITGYDKEDVLRRTEELFKNEFKILSEGHDFADLEAALKNKYFQSQDTYDSICFFEDFAFHSDKKPLNFNPTY